MACITYLEMCKTTTKMLLNLAANIKSFATIFKKTPYVFAGVSFWYFTFLMISSSSTVKLYLNSLVYDRNILRSSSKVFDNLQLSSEIFGDLQKFLEYVQKHSCAETFRQVWSIFENLRKVVRNLWKIVTMLLSDEYV